MEAARIEAGFNRAVSDRVIYRPDRLEQALTVKACLYAGFNS